VAITFLLIIWNENQIRAVIRKHLAGTSVGAETAIHPGLSPGMSFFFPSLRCAIQKALVEHRSLTLQPFKHLRSISHLTYSLHTIGMPSPSALRLNILFIVTVRCCEPSNGTSACECETASSPGKSVVRVWPAHDTSESSPVRLLLSLCTFVIPFGSFARPSIRPCACVDRRSSKRFPPSWFQRSGTSDGGLPHRSHEDSEG